MSDPKPNSASYWTPEKKEEWKHRAVADAMCRKAEFVQAKAYSLAHNISWPPFRSSPIGADKRSLTSAINGRKGGAPKITLATPQDTEKLIETVAHSLLTKGTVGIRIDPRLGEISDKDRNSLQKLTKITAEEFNSRLATKLGDLADELVDSLRDDVKNNRLKPGEKAFPLAVSIDKRANLDGRLQVAHAAVNIQVNNFAGRLTRAEIEARLSLTNVTPPPPLPPPEPPPIPI